MANKPKLSDTQKLAAKAAYDKYRLAGMTRQAALERVADELKVHWQTIRSIIAGSKSLDSQQLKDIKLQQASQIDNIVNSILCDLENSNKTLKGLSPAQSALAICQLIDKSMKLKGEDVTQIEIKEVGEKVQKRLEELRDLKESLKQSLVLPSKPEDN